MANIGVVTFSNTYDNYGQVLQFIATKEYLAGRGHNVFLLREEQKMKSIFFSWLRKKKEHLHSFIRKVSGDKREDSNLIFEQWAKIVKKNEKLHPRHFEEYRRTHFQIVDNSKKQLQVHNIDCLCIGSDQIWSFVSDFSFLGFGTDSMKRISIAPSMGLVSMNEEKKVQIGHYLKRFNFITTREKSGEKLCHEIGFMDAKRILDPTLLIDATIYDKYASEYSENGYLFVYLLGAESSINIDDIISFANSHNLSIKYVASQGRTDYYADKIFATVPEWIGLMKKARYVITNSFHGMALSVIYRKQFLVLPVIGPTSKMNERLYDFTETLGLSDRIYRKDLSEIFERIDYKKAETEISANKYILDGLMDKEGL